MGQIRRLPAGSVLLAEDETDLLLFPPLRSGWAKRGEAVEVRLSGFNARRVVFGTMDLGSGERLFLIEERQRSREFQSFLETIHRQYRTDRERPIALLLDEDPSHTAKASLARIEALGITPLWLPKRSPELNPMEALWGHAKDHLCANHQYATIEEQAVRFVEFLQRLSNAEALRLAGVHSHQFWLKSVLSKYFCGPA